MKVITSTQEASSFFSTLSGHAFVPTMGALHEGHATLIREAAKDHPDTVVSIFVNPLQFGQNEDLEKYPRTFDQDLEVCKSSGANIVFAPVAYEITEGLTTTIHVERVSEQYEGAHRPGHFDGVATIVLKLFNIVRPKTAIFGLKDLQQCAILRRMVNDLNVPVELRFIDTVREPSGLAMSSRNRYFTNEQKQTAVKLSVILRQIVQDLTIQKGNLQDELKRGRQELAAIGFDVDYLDLVDPILMEPTTTSNTAARVIVAARIFDIRLIDNWPLYPMA